MSTETNKPMGKVSPATCSEEQLCQMKRDHFEVGDFSIMTDTYRVWVSEQKMGEPQKQHVEIPRAVFNRLIHWYTKPATLRPNP